MIDLDTDPVQLEDLAWQLVAAELAPDGVQPILSRPGAYSRYTRQVRFRWSPGTEIADVWHLVPRYNISIIYPSCAPCPCPLSLHSPWLGVAHMAWNSSIPLAIGRFALRCRAQEVATKHEKEVTR